jgi:uracil phosphoribosyltransferase
MARVILRAADIDGYLSGTDKDHLARMDGYYREALDAFEALSVSRNEVRLKTEKERLISLYDCMGKFMQEITGPEPSIQVYSFAAPKENHGQASRLIAKLRDIRTSQHEFVYYIQRAYEMLFNFAYTEASGTDKNYLIVKTPVCLPVQNYAVHKIPDVDAAIENSVMCVMLRGALLPSMIMSKEMQEYSSTGYITPFAMFRIRRDDNKKESDMEYVLDLARSYFKIEDLDGRDLVFADPMNATGGSLVTVVKYLLDQGIKPRSIKFFTVISALKGALRIARALENVCVYTLWMDPVLNEAAYILPGLGDAGDRINGVDPEEHPRNLIQLMADYGSDIAALYRAQIRRIEKTVLGA